MRPVPTLLLAAALALGAGATLASDPAAPYGQTYRFYNSDGTYSTLVLPADRQEVTRVYHADGTYTYVVQGAAAAPVMTAPAMTAPPVTQYRVYHADGSYSVYVPSAQPEPYRAVPLVPAPSAQQLYTPPGHSYATVPGGYVATAPYGTYPQGAYGHYQPQGVSQQDGSDLFMVRYDTDGDGDLGDEQVVMRSRAQIEAEGNVTLMESHAVEPVDSNGDGFVSADEWRAEHPAYLGSLDLNNNGTPDNLE